MVVSNTAPLIHLAALQHLELLKELFGIVQIPEEVWNEAVEQGQGRPGESEIRAACEAGWMEVKVVHSCPLLKTLSAKLDEGEAAALVLAVEMAPGYIVMDEAPGRREAEALELPVIGTLGILGKAKKAGLIDLVRPIVEKHSSFHIKDELLERFLEAIGEEPSAT